MNQHLFVTLLFAVISFAACTQSSVTLQAKRVMRFVDAMPPTKVDFEQSIEFTGAIEPSQYVNLNFAVPGRIASCRIRAGASVKRGEEICRLEDTVVNLEVKRAEEAYQAAARVNATKFVDKQRKLFEAGVIGQAEFEQLRIQSEGAKATQSDTHTVYELALKKKSEHVLRAPWDGLVVKVLMRAGQLTAPEVPVAIVSGHEGLQIKTELPASAFSNIAVGSSATLTSGTVRLKTEDEVWRVTEKAVSVNPTTQTFSVVLASTKLSARSALAPGMLVSGVVHSQKIPNTLVVPQSSLYTIDAKGQAQLFVVEEGRLKLRTIEIGAANGKQAQVIGGVSSSDTVVTKIAPDFTDGMMVEVSQ